MKPIDLDIIDPGREFYWQDTKYVWTGKTRMNPPAFDAVYQLREVETDEIILVHEDKLTDLQED